MFRRLMVVGLLMVVGGCPAPTPSATLPSGIPVEDLPVSQQALLRLTLSIDGGVLAESELVLDGTRISGDVSLNNVEADGDRTARLRLYGRASGEASEVLLGEAVKSVFIAQNGESRVDFNADDVFDTCGAAAPPCALRFDVNRNGDSNLTDLLPADKGGRGIDPGPQAPVLDLAPGTLQFPSGVAVGTFARQVIVAENVGENPIRVVSAEVVAAPGAGLALFDPSGAPSSSAKRRLDGALFQPVAPGGEQLIAVSFAPANAFLTTGAVLLVVEDTVTAVRQTARVRLIGNPDGAVRVPGAGDTETVAFAGDVGIPVFAWPSGRLASGAPISSADPAAAEGLGLAAVEGAVTLTGGAVVGADVGYVVDLPAGQRLSVALDGLESDVDVVVVDLAAGDIVGDVACAACASRNAGASPEGVDLQNDSATARRLLVLLERVDLEGAPATVPFSLGLLASDAPSFVDDNPVTPPTGPLEGGTPVTLVGRGWDPRASIRVGGNAALDVDITTDPATGLSIARCSMPAGPADPSAASAAIVVQNPGVVDGGDGQAAVLPDGYLYQPPAPRLDVILPAVASTGTNIAPITLTGAFFSRRGGEPVVRFDGVAVDGVFVDASTIEVVPPSGRPAGVAFVTVANRLGRLGDVDVLSAPSAARPFSFLVAQGPAPVIADVTPASASVDGGDTITITGTNFSSDCAVFIGGSAAPVTVTSSTSLQVTVPPRVVGGQADLVVQNGDGQATVRRGGFTYVIPAPGIEGVFPTRAASTGGTLISVAGVGFRPGARARFVDAGGTAVAAAGQTVVSSRSMLVGCPPLTAGTWTLHIDNLDQTTSSFPGFTVFTPVGLGPAPVALEPATGSTLGGTAVTFVGRNLVDVTITVGAQTLPRQQTTLVRGVGGDPDRASFVTPPAPGGLAQSVVVQVINGDGQSAALTFTYVDGTGAGPRIDGIAPGRVSGTHPVELVVSGENFQPGATVLIGGSPVQATVTSTSIRCLVTPRPRGSAAITVTNPDGTEASYPLEVTGAPVIAGLSTSSVHALVPGDQVIVIGDALDVDPVEALTITGPLGDQPGTIVQAANGFLVVEVPGLPGDDAWGVLVEYDGGDAATSPQTFEAIPPTIEQVNPIVVGGAVLLEVIGDALNPAAFDAVVLDAAGQPTSTCAPLSRTERRVVCRPQPALVPGVNYGATLAWEGTFGGEPIPVTLPAVFVGTDAPVVVTGQTLTTTGADRPLPSDTSLLGVTFSTTVAGAAVQPQMTAVVDGVVLGDVTAVVGDVITVTCRDVQFAPATRPLTIQTAGFDYAIGGTVTFAPSSVATLSPSTLTWSDGFTASGTLGAGDTLVAVRQDDPTTVVDLPTTPGAGTATCDDTTGLSAGAWTICTSATRAACAGPTLVVNGVSAEIEGQDNALTPGATATGAFDAGGDVWFVHAAAGAPLVTTVDAGGSCGARTTVELVAFAPGSRSRTEGRRLAAATAQPGGCVATAAAIAPAAGEYAVVVTMPTPAGSYTVSLDTDGTESEPNDVDGDVLGVDAGAACEGGTFSSATDVDAWTFSLSTPQSIGVALDVGPACATPVRVVVSRAGAVLAQAVGAPGTCPSLATPVLSPGAYVVSVAPAAAPAVTTSWTMTWSASRCGDGVVAGAEACDDGATVGGDGCSSSCALEGQAICVGAPSRCVTDVIFVDDMESGANGWTQQGDNAWAQVQAAGNTTWQWSKPADGDPQSVAVFNDVLVSPPLDFTLVDPTGGVFVACGHRDDRLGRDTLLGLEVLTATNSPTPPGPVQPVAGYPRDGGWGQTGTAAVVRDVFDLSPWAGATNVTLGIRAEGSTEDATESRWFFDDVAVVGVVGDPVVPDTWACSASFFATGDGCDCGCGALDPDCTDSDVGACDYCDNLGSCNVGGGCPGNIDPSNNSTCVVR